MFSKHIQTTKVSLECCICQGIRALCITTLGPVRLQRTLAFQGPPSKQDRAENQYKERGIYYSKVHCGHPAPEGEMATHHPAYLITLCTVCPVECVYLLQTSATPRQLAPDFPPSQEVGPRHSPPSRRWAPRPSPTPRRPCLLAPDLSFLEGGTSLGSLPCSHLGMVPAPLS